MSARRIPPHLQVVSCLRRGVSATNGIKTPSLSLSLQLPPDIRSQEPCASHPHHPCILPSSQLRHSPRSSSSKWETWLEAPWSPAPPFAPPCAGSRRAAASPAQAARTQTQPPASQPQPALRTRAQIYNQALHRGLLAPTIIQQLICAHRWQREHYVLMGSLLCLELTLYKANK